jgi:phenylacetic acid degradation operon negative regulatory protein
MARQGWLAQVRLPGGAGYRLTPAAVRRLRQAGDRIYRREQPRWDGRWHVVVTERLAERAKRERLRSALGYLGYACLDGATWISPRPSVELDALLGAERVRAERFVARYQGDQRGLAARAWDLDGLASAYAAWIGQARAILAPVAGPATAPDELADETVFAVRSELVHEWRKFLFVDPALPAELLPARWPGNDAAGLFHAEADRLLPAASRFVDRCLAGDKADGAASQAARGSRDGG